MTATNWKMSGTIYLLLRIEVVQLEEGKILIEVSTERFADGVGPPGRIKSGTGHVTEG
jgi:hypothetical protein